MTKPMATLVIRAAGLVDKDATRWKLQGWRRVFRQEDQHSLVHFRSNTGDELFLKTAEVIALLRDERKGRLLISF